MKKYRWTLKLDYDVEAEDEEDAIYQIADLLHQDYVFLIDEGDLEERTNDWPTL